jgi:adenosylcobyric acid synthase
VLGICGGYQMLGRTLRDPLGIESTAGEASGLGLLSAVTTFAPGKTTVRVRGHAEASAGLFAAASGSELSAYEIHMGVTETGDARHPFTVTWRNGATVDEADGAINARGNVVGTYLHGLLANDAVRRALLVDLAGRKGVDPDPRWGCRPGADRYDRLADVVGGAIDLALLARLLRVDPRRLSSS